MTSPEFRDQSPKQIVPVLASPGEYVGSESTLSRPKACNTVAVPHGCLCRLPTRTLPTGRCSSALGTSPIFVVT